MMEITQDITIHQLIVFTFIIYIYNPYIVLGHFKSSSNIGNVLNMSRTRNYSNNFHLTNIDSNIQLQLQPTPTFRKLNFHNKVLSSNHLRFNTDVQEHTYIQLKNHNNNNNIHANHNSSYSSLSQKTSSLNKAINNNIKIINAKQLYIETNHLKHTKHHSKKSTTKDTTSFSSYSNTNTTNTKHRYSSNNSEKIDTPEDLHFFYVHIIQNGKELENNF